MIKISTSQAARLLHIPRDEMQKSIKEGRVQTHEGLVTLDSLKRAYPEADLDQDSSKIFIRTQSIKENASKNKSKSKIAINDNEAFLKNVISDLNEKITKLEGTITRLLRDNS